MEKQKQTEKPSKNTSALTPSDIEELDRASAEELNAIMSRAGKEIEETVLAEKEDTVVVATELLHSGRILPEEIAALGEP